MTIAHIAVRLSLNAVQFHREMDSAARRIERTGRVIARAGREMSQAISLPLIVAGFAAFHALLEDSRRRFGPLLSAFESLKAELRALSLAVGRELQPVFMDLITIFRTGIAIVRGWVQAFHELSPGMQSAIIHTLAFLAALGPTLLIVGKLITGVAAMGKMFMLLLTPTGLIAAAIIALAAAAIYVATHWDQVKLRLVLAWTAVKIAVYDSVRGILAGFAALVEGGANVSAALSGMPGLAGAAFMAMGVGLAQAADGIHALQKNFDAFADSSLAKSAARILALQKTLDEASHSAKSFTDTASVMDEVLKNLAGSIERTKRMSQVLGPTFNVGAEQAQAFQKAIQDAIARGVDPMSRQMQLLGMYYLQSSNNAQEFTRALNALGPTLEQQMKAIAQQQEMIRMGITPHLASDALVAEGAIIQDVMQGIADGIATVASRIGDLFSGMSTRVKGFFGAIGSVLAGVMKMIGKTLVELGVVSIMYGKLGFAIKFFAKNPLAAIAVGAALIALGNTLGAQAERISSAGLSEGGGGGGGGAAAVGSPGASSGPEVIVLELRGDQVIGSIFADPRNQDALADAIGEITGRRIVISST